MQSINLQTPERLLLQLKQKRRRRACLLRFETGDIRMYCWVPSKLLLRSSARYSLTQRFKNVLGSYPLMSVTFCVSGVSSALSMS